MGLLDPNSKEYQTAVNQLYTGNYRGNDMYAHSPPQELGGIFGEWGTPAQWDGLLNMPKNNFQYESQGFNYTPQEFNYTPQSFSYEPQPFTYDPKPFNFGVK